MTARTGLQVWQLALAMNVLMPLALPSLTLAQIAAPSSRSVAPEAWAGCPRVTEGLARIERLNAAAIESRDTRALRDPARRCDAYAKQIAATEKLLNAAEDTRSAILACKDDAITATMKNQLDGLLRLQAGMTADTLNHLRGARAKACPGP